MYKCYLLVALLTCRCDHAVHERQNVLPPLFCTVVEPFQNVHTSDIVSSEIYTQERNWKMGVPFVNTFDL